MDRYGCISVSMVLAAISDNISIYLLSRVALAEADTEALLSETGLSPKALYFRMARSLKLGVISRRKGKYFLTSFGKIVYHAQDMIAVALHNYWRLSALDSLSILGVLPEAEYNRISDTLLGDLRIKKVLALHLEEKPNNQSPICLDEISTTTQRSKNTVRGLQAT
jgi:hypothetical protein